MRHHLLLSLLVGLFPLTVSHADDLDISTAFKAPSVSQDWRVIDRTRPIHRSKGWTWRIYRHTSNGDLLTIACLDSPSFIKSAHLRDCALEFAPSGYPNWIHIDFGYSVTPVKMTESQILVSDDNRDLARTNVPVLEFTNVNVHMENDDDTLMVNGFVFVIAEKTYYVQHTSKRPSPNWTAQRFAQQLAVDCLVAQASSTPTQTTK